MQNIKAVIFDFDDTLQDREAAYHIFVAHFLQKFFPDTDRTTHMNMKKEMEEHVNGGYINPKKYFPFLMDLWKVENPPSTEEMSAYFLTKYGKHIVFMPNALPTIEYLQEKGYKLGIITNGPSLLQNTKVDTSGLRAFVDEVIVSGDTDYHKPDRKIFELMAERLHVPVEECVFVGDHPINDVEGAVNAGMHAIWMNFGTFENDYDGTAPVIHDLKELRELL